MYLLCYGTLAGQILSIRKVLYHELAHNDVSPHNDDFYMLMRQVPEVLPSFFPPLVDDHKMTKECTHLWTTLTACSCGLKFVSSKTLSKVSGKLAV